ncbi:hypothetical protein E4U41_002781 [Claviceps citrina]|nr:hypothetical protein E4U41_002781 [Claviceps citrina]
MAHIASCVANAEHSSISRPLSPAPSTFSTTQSTSSSDRSFTWRMLLPTDPCRYQSHSKDKPMPGLKSNRAPDSKAGVETPLVVEKQTAGCGPRHRPHLQAPSARRRKISVPELGTMTTVREEVMDSPTIPGLPPMHERSISAPIERAHAFSPKQPASVRAQPQPESLSGSLSPIFIPVPEPVLSLLRPGRTGAKLSMDSTSSWSSQGTGMDLSRTGLTSSSTPNLSYHRSAIAPDGASSATLPAFPSTWENSTTLRSAQSVRHVLPATTDRHGKPHVPLHHHHRGCSEPSSSSPGTDRSRPRKRADTQTNNAPAAFEEEDGQNKGAISPERRAFEELPRGWQPAEARQKLSATELSALQKQALEQVGRYEILKADDVDALSKELRQLDERTEYLRQTQTSLRAGRRSLHARVCQYLRSPRVAKFSHQSLLKQEEALAELDASIDDWGAKLDQAENRRIRVRQKLLEHVAAAATIAGPEAATRIIMAASIQQGMGMQSPTRPRELSTPPRSPLQSSFSSRGSNASSSPSSLSPFPSPSPSPSPSSSSQRVAAQVPSTIFEQPVLEEKAEDEAHEAHEAHLNSSRRTSIVSIRRGDVESIRVYAQEDVFALLADVENEVISMGGLGSSPTLALAPPPEPVAADQEQAKDDGSELERQREWQRSHEKLNGYGSSSSHFVSPWTSPRPRARRARAVPFSPETSPTTMYLSSPTGSPVAVVPRSRGSSVSGIIISIYSDVEGLSPCPLAYAADKAAEEEEGPFLTSAVFKP